MYYCTFCNKELEKEVLLSFKDCFCSEECYENYFLIDEKTISDDQIICPYCKYEYYDSWEMREDEDDEYECSNCGEVFSVVRDIQVSYTSTPKIEVLLKLKE